MKKVLLGLVALSAVSFATQGDMYLNARVGMDLGAKYENISDSGTTFLTDETDGFGGEFALEGYKSLTDNLDLGLGLAYQMHADRDTVDLSYGEFSGGEYDSIPVYLIAKYNFNMNSEIKPYLKANLGYSFNFNESDVDAKARGANTSPDFKINTDVENGLYWALGGGVEYKNFIVDLMYAVTTAKSKAKYDALSLDVKEDNDYGRFVLSAGYRFDL